MGEFAVTPPSSSDQLALQAYRQQILQAQVNSATEVMGASDDTIDYIVEKQRVTTRHVIERGVAYLEHIGQVLDITA